MLAVCDGRDCIGFLLKRGGGSVEAFTADEHSLGTFPDLKTAANALSEREGAA